MQGEKACRPGGLAYTACGATGKWTKKPVIAKEIEAIAKERMGEVDQPPIVVIAKHHVHEVVTGSRCTYTYFNCTNETRAFMLK